ncbi:MAG: cupin domain-containing protein [Chitinophagaceae bacterium]|nr:cupin domain-containing protein [Chitinophagaceae bacterium]
MLIAILLLASTSHSQDFMSTNPKMCKLLGDTLNSKMMLVTFAPGETTVSHTHPSHIIYALTPGDLKIVYADGRTENVHIKAGQSVTFPPDPAHRTTNVGKMPMKMILLEISQ